MTTPQHRADSFYVWSRIYPGRVSWIMWILVGITGTVIIPESFRDKSKWELYIGIALVSAAVLRYISVQLMKRVTYSTYKNFLSELNFRVNDWSNLEKFPDLMKRQYWAFDCSIAVEVRPTATDADKKYVHDALFLFTGLANERYYRGTKGNGPKKWKFEKELELAGSADGAVTGDMYVLLYDYLRGVQEKCGCIEVVNLSWGKEVDYVKFQKGAY
ncbi:hypothetical protein BH11BAC7_BH11BAC7_22300 [soil metagenome]